MESENTFLRPGSKEAQEQGCLCPVLDNGGATEADAKSKLASNDDYITTIKVEWEE